MHLLFIFAARFWRNSRLLHVRSLGCFWTRPWVYWSISPNKLCRKLCYRKNYFLSVSLNQAPSNMLKLHAFYKCAFYHIFSPTSLSCSCNEMCMCRSKGKVNNEVAGVLSLQHNSHFNIKSRAVLWISMRFNRVLFVCSGWRTEAMEVGLFTIQKKRKMIWTEPSV